MDEFDKKVNDKITTHNNKLTFFNCEFKIEFDNQFKRNTESEYFYNVDSNNVKSSFYTTLIVLNQEDINFIIFINSPSIQLVTDGT